MTKRSAAKLREGIVFFIDRSLGKVDVPGALRAIGCVCELHDDKFDQDTEDADWLSSVAVRKLVVLTKDERIRYRPLELKALEAARLRVFIVICGNTRGAETGRIPAKAMPGILNVLSTRNGPFIYYVYKNSTLKAAEGLIKFG